MPFFSKYVLEIQLLSYLTGLKIIVLIVKIEGQSQQKVSNMKSPQDYNNTNYKNGCEKCLHNKLRCMTVWNFPGAQTLILKTPKSGILPNFVKTNCGGGLVELAGKYSGVLKLLEWTEEEFPRWDQTN